MWSFKDTDSIATFLCFKVLSGFVIVYAVLSSFSVVLVVALDQKQMNCTLFFLQWAKQLHQLNFVRMCPAGCCYITPPARVTGGRDFLLGEKCSRYPPFFLFLSLFQRFFRSVKWLLLLLSLVFWKGPVVMVGGVFGLENKGNHTFNPKAFFFLLWECVPYISPWSTVYVIIFFAFILYLWTYPYYLANCKH